MDLKTSGDVEDILSIYIASAALRTALELGLFWRLANEPSSVEGVSRAYGIPPIRCKSWLELLTGMGLLEQKGGIYGPSCTTQNVIIGTHSPEAWAFLAQEAHETYLAGSNLTKLISHPDSVWAFHGQEPPNYVTKMIEDPEWARSFTRMLYEVHRLFAEKLAKTLDMTGVSRLLDLGGGSGVLSLTLLKHNPRLEAVVVDIPNVCRAGREIADATSLSWRIRYHPADFLQDSLPTGFDMIIECDVGIYTEELFRKLHASLNVGGRLVIVDWLAQLDQQLPFWRLCGAFISSLGASPSTNQTSQAVEKLLVQAGFHHLSLEQMDNSAVIIHAQK